MGAAVTLEELLIQAYYLGTGPDKIEKLGPQPAPPERQVLWAGLNCSGSIAGRLTHLMDYKIAACRLSTWRMPAHRDP
jgi:hypothetical protein